MKDFIRHGIISVWETREPGGLPSFGWATLQSLERGALLMYITYSDFIQTGIFISALVRLCHTIFKDSKQRVACRLFVRTSGMRSINFFSVSCASLKCPSSFSGQFLTKQTILRRKITPPSSARLLSAVQSWWRILLEGCNALCGK